MNTVLGWNWSYEDNTEVYTVFNKDKGIQM